ncbi:T9SS type A sorting domain-containing protein [Psychroserpens luteus]|uniref:T9SS type A sorting domain-containing protein n=1 Tax=Psychroserpens luteus TaxID=1434066 RepID=A0ABW6A074_9FLAO|nr:T9SS type A sorting domain-containing protein [Psychroserpens luteus]
MKTKLLYVFLFISTFAYAQFPTNDLIAWYDFGDGFLLVDGANGQDFTQTGNALTEINNRFSDPSTSAIDLNGDYLTRPDIAISGNTGLDFAVTFSFWLKSNTNTNDVKTVIDDSTRDTSIGFDGNDVGYYIFYRDGKISLSSRFYTASPGVSSPVPEGYGHAHPQVISDGNWHHIVVLYNPTFISGIQRINSKIYIDGVVNSKSVNNGTSSFTTSPNQAGNVTIANSRFNHLALANQYTDVIDDILIYNRALTPAEVTSIGNYNNYCFTPSSSILSVSGITGTEANIDMVNNSNTFDLAYHKASESFSNAIIISGITSATPTSQANLTGLDISTDYLVYVREQCANVTDWSQAVMFSTVRPYGKLYVNQNATGANNGLSWTDAFTNLQSALTEVIAGEEIWISSGTYTPHASNRGIYFVIDKEDLKLYGGFDGTEMQLADRTIGVNETILSADLQANDVNVSDYPGNYANTTRNADNSYRVVNITAAGNNLLLDGLTISDAHNNANATTRGAAIAKDKTISHLTLRNCIVKNNVSRNDNAGLVAEFELNNTSGTRGELIIENCQFVNNMSRWASGIYSFVRGNTNVDITVANTLFDGNIAADLSSTVTGISGSASWFRVLTNGSNITLNLTNNTYVNNIDLGTAQSVNNFSRATVAISKAAGISSVFNASVNNCIFWENTTAGGVTTRSITDQYTSPANSLIINNSLDPLSFNDDSITSTNTIINSNPLFTNSANNDYTLTSISPAVDTGDNVYVLGATDLLGNQRILNSTVDMGAYEFDSSTLGVHDMSLGENDIKLYPNPTSSILNIEMNTILKNAIIFNIQGQKVIESVSNQFDVSRLSNGLYIIKIEDENGSVSTKRFIRE